MRRIIVILLVGILMSCATLRYGDNLTAPYSQTELEMSGAVAIGFGIVSVFLGQFIYEETR